MVTFCCIIHHYHDSALFDTEGITPVEGSVSLGLDAINKTTAHPNGGLLQLHAFKGP